ncbi:dihydroneopterin aldolase [Vitreoscilla massiliensis]|uniref:dihydroneopterin aldolase n=1 Tax=Vitreoscilla massiliensis TaxID=1689272 RepID=A0ABY4E069_9NEIS|nr:dihydroneopterin aldolase [Vitreoscilla massiliensis]UOO88952.1 dihydroneopterin aldolase [Vitreoscilla massiliensis]
MDIIFLNGMAVETLVGVYDWERQHSQTLYLDLQVGIAANSQRNDDLSRTLSYADIAQIVRTEMAAQSFQLLESVGEHIAQVLLQQAGVLQVSIKVMKPGILPGVREVGIHITRTQTSGL